MTTINIKEDVGLPSELVLLILSFADPQTLARCAQLSFELLKYVSPFLYTKVTLHHAESYGQLFCERVSPFSKFEGSGRIENDLEVEKDGRERARSS